MKKTKTKLSHAVSSSHVDARLQCNSASEDSNQTQDRRRNAVNKTILWKISSEKRSS